MYREKDNSYDREKMEAIEAANNILKGKSSELVGESYDNPGKIFPDEIYYLRFFFMKYFKDREPLVSDLPFKTQADFMAWDFDLFINDRLVKLRETGSSSMRNREEILKKLSISRLGLLIDRQKDSAKVNFDLDKTVSAAGEFAKWSRRSRVAREASRLRGEGEL
ncbi:MAG TPA: hypothetical protein VHE53_05410 [Patescibacteria group bacterium]|nr:hypothetical protein [Patescibacteria group bacterium]